MVREFFKKVAFKVTKTTPAQTTAFTNSKAAPAPVKTPVENWKNSKYAKSFFIANAYFTALSKGMQKAEFYPLVEKLSNSGYSNGYRTITINWGSGIASDTTKKELEELVFNYLKCQLNIAVLEKNTSGLEFYNSWMEILNPDQVMTAEQFKKAEKIAVFNSFIKAFEEPKERFVI